MNDTPTPADAAPAPPPTAHRTNRSALVILFLVVFVDLLGFGIVLPMLPIIARRYIPGYVEGSNPSAGLILGLLLASFSLMQFLFAPFWGGLSDRVGRRPILIVGLVGSVIFYALFGFAASLTASEHALLALTLLFI